MSAACQKRTEASPGLGVANRSHDSPATWSRETADCGWNERTFAQFCVHRIDGVCNTFHSCRRFPVKASSTIISTFALGSSTFAP